MLGAILLLLAALPAAAQNPPSDTVVSPEVHPDRRVTFRVFAPQAGQAAFAGDWMPRGTSQPMKKGANGVWSLTVGPLEPNVYIYSFSVDGMTIADPVNPRVKLRSSTSASMVEVPSDPPLVWHERDVPHGTVAITWHKSKVLGDTRWVWTYTPPGYETGSAKLPVLYLLHGSNDTAGGWVLAGHANFILDNLIAEKKAVPMIVVMPYTHAVPFGSPREIQATNVEKFRDYLVGDVIPLIESKYRVKAGRENRAITGLSMGGGQALAIGMERMDLFSAVGAFSSAVPAEFESKFQQALAQPAKTNERLKLFWVGCGTDDFLFERNQDLHQLLEKRGIRHTYRATKGAHTYSVWREYLAEVVPMLFRW